jgi:hypothetical protein
MKLHVLTAYCQCDKADAYDMIVGNETSFRIPPHRICKASHLKLEKNKEEG